MGKFWVMLLSSNRSWRIGPSPPISSRARCLLRELDQPALHGHRHGLSAVASAQLAQDRADVKFDRALGDVYLGGDLLVLQALRQ